MRGSAAPRNVLACFRLLGRKSWVKSTCRHLPDANHLGACAKHPSTASRHPRNHERNRRFRIGRSVISCYDINVTAHTEARVPDPLVRTLADFRFELRQFLHFSEQAAIDAGLQPQQHQLLLQVAGAPEDATVTIAYAAERLGLKHNSAVELVDRSVREDLLERMEDPSDRRRALLRVTRKGHRVLSRLSGEHLRELTEAAPRLARTLHHIQRHADTEVAR